MRCMPYAPSPQCACLTNMPPSLRALPHGRLLTATIPSLSPLQVRRSDAGYLLYLIMRGAVDQVRV